jgi:hypothetical protein
MQPQDKTESPSPESRRFQDALKRLLSAKPTPAQARPSVKKHAGKKPKAKNG